MNGNQILIIAIIVLIGVILVFGVYFLLIYLKMKKSEKKTDTIFNPNNLVEEESLLNIMDEKRNLEFKSENNNEKNTFLTENESVDMVSNGLTREQKSNPFGIDMTAPQSHSNDVNLEEKRSENKFFN